ncbi:MAG: 16S rRNA (adenine(1518)-N(6)/adenine(1519)-N(6))-dimethyltransferase RsmA [Cyclonatronaceae bacterium]
MSIRPKKSLGQHFLKDPNVARRIVDSVQAGRQERVVEIGPGTGALTIPLSRRYPDLHVFEVDERAVDVIRQTCPDVTVHSLSFLDADPEALKTGYSGDLFVVGNLPYFLTSPILFRVLDQGAFFTQAVFMIQKEVAQRLVARPRTREYGILSVQAQVLGRIELLFPVSRHVFQPPPRVESAVISYRPGNDLFPASAADLPVSLNRFKTVVRTAFQQRRKRLSNALKSLFGDAFPEGFDTGRRAEELEPEEFVMLAEWLYRNH